MSFEVAELIDTLRKAVELLMVIPDARALDIEQLEQMIEWYLPEYMQGGDEE